MRLTDFFAAAGLALSANVALAAPLPRDAVILPGHLVGAMLHQCSRRTPSMAESTWQPSADDILALEAMLPKALKAQATKGDPNCSMAPSSWRRQYIGIVVKGKRLIYGNYIPKGIEPGKWRTSPLIMCDGGPRYFGVVYDVSARRIIKLDFNGEA